LNTSALRITTSDGTKAAKDTQQSVPTDVG